MCNLPLSTQGWRLTTHIVQIMFASHLFLSYGYEIGPTDGHSMLPTVNRTGDFILVEKWTHLSERGFKAGDIVQARHPYNNYPVLKRIIGRVFTDCRGADVDGRVGISCVWTHCRGGISKYQKDTCGYKETIWLTRLIHGTTVLFLRRY